MEKFLHEISNQNNHRHFLFKALERTEGTVVEMGMGHGSTPYLHEYCKDHGRELFSYETNEEWLNKFQHLKSDFHHHALIKDWDHVHRSHTNPAVVLVDHAPGERRKEDIKMWRGYCEILVAHDTEPAADHGYQMRDILRTYDFMKDWETEGAWATVVSMKHDVREL